MKYILLLLLSLPIYAKEPMFALGQPVLYKVPPFYRLACSGEGIISGFYKKGNTIIYGLYTSDIFPNPDCFHCPNLELPESQIRVKIEVNP